MTAPTDRPAEGARHTYRAAKYRRPSDSAVRKGLTLSGEPLAPGCCDKPPRDPVHRREPETIDLMEKLVEHLKVVSPASAPDHTDLMVTPESIDAYLEANPPPSPLPPQRGEERRIGKMEPLYRDKPDLDEFDKFVLSNSWHFAACSCQHDSGCAGRLAGIIRRFAAAFVSPDAELRRAAEEVVRCFREDAKAIIHGCIDDLERALGGKE